MALETINESSTQSLNLDITLAENIVGTVYAGLDNLGNINSGFNITRPDLVFANADNVTELTANIHTAIDDFLKQAKANFDLNTPAE